MGSSYQKYILIFRFQFSSLNFYSLLHLRYSHVVLNSECLWHENSTDLVFDHVLLFCLDLINATEGLVDETTAHKIIANELIKQTNLQPTRSMRK